MRAFIICGFLAATAALVASRRAETFPPAPAIGIDRIVSMEALPETSEDSCEVPSGPKGPGLRATAARQATEGADISARKPARVIADPNFSFAGVAVDPLRNEVVLADENVSALVVYDRLAKTSPTAAKTEPKRVIEGDKTFIEYAASVYIDPETGDIFGINNDTMNWMPVFGRDAQGNVAPKRTLQTPHTTYGVAVDEAAGELFLTIQDDHAVVVFDKHAKDADPDPARRSPTPGSPPPSPLRILQGSRTRMADPHGIALDPKRGEIFVANWGTSNERPPLTEGGGGGSVNRKDFPVGRRRTFRGSGRIQPPSITVYSKAAGGDTAPVRVIQGQHTQMNWPTGLAVHPDRAELFVANDVGNAVLVFGADASGDVAPIRVLKGPRSLIKNPTGVAVDVKNNELWVANFGNHSATVYAIDAKGDAAPLRVIRSAPVTAQSPMLSNAHTVAFDSKREELLVAS